MIDDAKLALQGLRLLQIGVILLLLTSLWGFVVPAMASPPMGLAAHRLCSLLAPLFLAFGLLWPKLSLQRPAALTAFALHIYSSAAIIAAYVLAALWGAGAETMSQAAAGYHGTAQQEMVIRMAAFSSAPTGIVAFTLILWGLRRADDQRRPPG